MDLCEVSMSLLGFGMETMLAIHMCVIMLVLRVVFNMLMRKVGYWAVMHRSSAYMKLLVPSRIG